MCIGSLSPFVSPGLLFLRVCIPNLSSSLCAASHCGNVKKSVQISNESLAPLNCHSWCAVTVSANCCISLLPGKKKCASLFH
ncbi:hypothetical protein BDB00DRAFT_405680 [Zychaea mexicana]|uniref:uncharacterized protein n=1 Tax=Zychaea mexicana TaxID=64656 RepID=UPI0022FE6651|nr:uncharacterized protein BDB00DRAFT_405680 [Zychaea mexicana]KAI9493028.1 hypothetical protein BDB00DRAFT_405680 [Zychaea mexicana]